MGPGLVNDDDVNDDYDGTTTKPTGNTIIDDDDADVILSIRSMTTDYFRTKLLNILISYFINTKLNGRKELKPKKRCCDLNSNNN